jgi:hypothetical protein
MSADMRDLIQFLQTTTGKLAAAIVFYLPFLCALVFLRFEGQTFESPIGGCCLSMPGLLGAAYVLFTIWVVAPFLAVTVMYKLYKQFVK